MKKRAIDLNLAALSASAAYSLNLASILDRFLSKRMSVSNPH
jgi:hypothetical protein